jgi:hypothetical protein
LSLLKSLLPVPVGLLDRLGLFRLIADMLWGYLDFAWGYQLYAASFGARRCHVSCIEPVIIQTGRLPIGFATIRY